MRIVIATSIEPFVDGGASLLTDWLAKTLRKHGHKVEEFQFPFSYHPSVLLEQMLALRLLDLHDSTDRLIAVRPPSYLLRHPKKVLWFIHHYRAAYDLWGGEYGAMADTPEGRRDRAAIQNADRVGLSEAHAIFSNSQVVSQRLKRFNGLNAEVLYPPLFEPERYFCREYGPNLLYVARLVRHKRQSLAIESLQHTKSGVGLTIAGKEGEAGYADELRRLAIKFGVEDRVTFLCDWISEEQKISLFADCLAAVYFPYDEDSYGFASLEAHHAQKAVLTTLDSGGTKELITDHENGLIVQSDPKAIAEAMDELYLNRALTRSMGQAAGQKPRELGITWDRVVEKLLQ